MNRLFGCVALAALVFVSFSGAVEAHDDCGDPDCNRGGKGKIASIN